MRNLLVFALITPFALIGCNSSDSGSSGSGGGGGSFSKSPTLQISTGSRAMVDEYVFGGIFGLEAGYSEFLFGDWSDFSVSFGQNASRLMERSLLSSRSINQTVTESCDSGSEVYKVTATGITESGDISTNGNFTLEIVSNNCRDEWWDDEYDITNGTMRYTISWTGYNAINQTFSSLNFTMRAINSSFYEYVDGELYSFEEADGEMSSSINGTTYANTLDVFLSSSDLNGEAIRLQTSTAISGSTDNEYPSSGQWIVRGAGNTSAQYSIVPNGVEVSVNSGQAELLTWEYIDDNYGHGGWSDWD